MNEIFILFYFCCWLQVWEMLLLARLEWDVSGVTAFDFVDQLMERLAVCRGHTRTDVRRTVRGHALTYVSLCCTGWCNE